MREVSFSPKVFLPVTRLCRNRCSYCSFRRDPDDPAAWTLAPEEVVAILDAGAAAGCTEALLCLGDTPETGFPAYHRLLRGWGFDSTVAYLEAIARLALERGLLPHTNAGILDAAALARLRRVNVSMGLMLESVSERLCAPGMPHDRAPDKRPAVRLAMLEEAGRQRIPFTTGLLVGMGETPSERIDTLEAIARVHARHGHIQEVIVQPFRAGEGTPMAGAPELDETELAEVIALARELLPRGVQVQSPPNLGRLGVLLAGGVDDLGGISPLTPDHINPAHPWPVLEELADEAGRNGVILVPRLPVTRRYIDAPGWVDPSLRRAVSQAQARLDTDPRWARLQGAREGQGAAW